MANIVLRRQTATMARGFLDASKPNRRSELFASLLMSKMIFPKKVRVFAFRVYEGDGEANTI